MISLIRKELKQLMPFALLWFCLVVMFYGAELATVRIDEQSYLGWCDQYCDVGTNVDIALFTILLYMIAAYSLFPREFDDYTVDFLRSLPLSRTSIFISKVLAAWILLCFLLVLDRIIQAAFLLMNTQTITGKHYWNIDLQFLLRDSLFAFVIVAHGVFLSWFRTVGLILYCIYLVSLIWLEQAAGVSGIYNIFSFFNNEYDGTNLLLDWTTIGFHITVALILLLISYMLWTRTDSKPSAPRRGKVTKLLLSIGLSIVSFLFVAGYMVSMTQRSVIESVDSGIRKLQTEHFHFSYRDVNESAMRKLEPFVEPDYQALVALLGAQTQPIIHADMTSDSEHALGLASWKKIRMVLESEDEVDPLYRRVLSHETAHVFQAVESDRMLAKAGGSVGFFIEGMAQYTSFSIVPDPESRQSNWLISSVAWDRHNIKFEEMVNRSVFESLYDPELLYGIGDIWVDAMAQACGEESIGNFLRAVKRKEAAPNLSGPTYWRYHLQHIGCELEEVNNLWRKLMQEAIEQQSAGAFPYFDNVVVTRSEATDLITISAELRADESGILPQYYYLRVQSEAKLANTVSPVLNGKLVTEGARATVEFAVLPRLIDGKRFRYQLGYTPVPDSRTYFDKWRSGAVPD